jgi:hypothetical protein
MLSILGNYALTGNAASTPELVTYATLSLSGTLAIGADALVNALSNMEMTGSPLADVDGTLTVAAGLDQSGGTLRLDASTGSVSLANAGATSHDISGGLLTISAGTYANADHFAIRSALAAVSGGTAALTVNASADANINSTGIVNLTGGTITASRDVIINSNGVVNVSGGTTSTNVARTLVVQGAGSGGRFNLTAPTTFVGGSLLVAGADGLVTLTASGATNVSFTGTMPDSWAPAYCDTGSDACSIAVTSTRVPTPISIGTSINLQATQAVYVGGTLTVDQGGALTT